MLIDVKIDKSIDGQIEVEMWLRRIDNTKPWTWAVSCMSTLIDMVDNSHERDAIVEGGHNRLYDSYHTMQSARMDIANVINIVRRYQTWWNGIELDASYTVKIDVNASIVVERMVSE